MFTKIDMFIGQNNKCAHQNRQVVLISCQVSASLCFRVRRSNSEPALQHAFPTAHSHSSCAAGKPLRKQLGSEPPSER